MRFAARICEDVEERLFAKVSGPVASPMWKFGPVAYSTGPSSNFLLQLATPRQPYGNHVWYRRTFAHHYYLSWELRRVNINVLLWYISYLEYTVLFSRANWVTFLTYT